MEKKLYVGNLPRSCREMDIEIFFTPAGRVDSVQIIRDKETGESRGFCFVAMDTEDGALKALQTLRGVPFKGEPLIIKEALPQEPRGKRPGFEA